MTGCNYKEDPCRASQMEDQAPMTLKSADQQNNSGTVAVAHPNIRHFDKHTTSGADQRSGEHFTYTMSSSTSTTSKPRHTGNPQTGEYTGLDKKSSRHCHPMCFARPSSYQTYAASRGDESRPLLNDKQSVPLSSIITERHPLGLGDDFFFDDTCSDSDEED